jgi:ubiquinone/menaquinone biosynthesis C-methylase UbiE
MFINNLTKGSKILDAGCAGGRDSYYFFQNGFNVTGLDYAIGNINYAKSKYTGVRFIEGDILKLPSILKKEEFDAVYTYCACNHLLKKDIPTAINNFNKVLHMGGILFIVTRKGKGVLWTNDKYSEFKKRRFTLIENDVLQKILKLNGFKIEYYETYASKIRPNMEAILAVCKKIKNS